MSKATRQAENRRRDVAEHCRRVDAWNHEHAIGTAVVYRMDSGKKVYTRTRSAAEMLSGHTAVVWLDDVSGCVALDRVTTFKDQVEATPQL